MCKTYERLQWLAEQFEEQRPHLRTVAYRLLGSTAEADDAIQEAWLRLQRSDTASVHNLGGWLTTVVSRICLDMLRSRTARREEPFDADLFQPDESSTPAAEHEAMLADSVGVALLVVLDTLTPDQRLTFVLHEVFGVPFQEIAPIIERTPAATKMLASRARHKIRTATSAPIPDHNPAQRREIVSAFLAAARGGDFDELLALLHPEAVFRSDDTAVRMGAPAQLHGAANLARQFSGRAQAARLALVDGIVAIAWAPHGQLRSVINFTTVDDKIQRIDVIADPTRIAEFQVEFITTD